MSSATDSNPPSTKRVRFDTDGSTTTRSKTSSTKSPSEAAQECAALAIASLPEPLKQMAGHWCTKINTAYAKLHRHQKIMALHSADPEFIPNSARFKFTLTGSKLVSGEDDFKQLAAQANETIDRCQKKLKELIAGAAKLEDSALKVELAKVLAEAIIRFAEMTLISITGKKATSDDLNFFAYEAFTDTVKNDLIVLGEAKLCALYTELTGSTFSDSDNLTGVSTTAEEFHDEFLDACNRLFVAPMKAYSDADDANAVSALIGRLTTSVITGSTTATTGMAMDDESTVSKTQLESLINSAVKKSTDTLRSQFKNELKNLATKSSSVPKNSARGAAPSASLKKKNKSTTTQQAQQKKKNPRTSTVVPKAAAANNVLPANNSRNTTTTGSGKSNRKSAPKTGSGRSNKK
jgi:hypothetical protein